MTRGRKNAQKVSGKGRDQARTDEDVLPSTNPAPTENPARPASTAPTKSDVKPSAPQVQYNDNYRSVLLLLLVFRVGSAFTNLIHDCDEVFNFLEPLHFLINGHGLQTWEHSSKFALRSYLYLAVHYLLTKPLSLLVQSRALQFVTFYGLRVALGCVCAFVEAELYDAVIKFGMSAAASYFVVFLVLSTGMFSSSTSFLPSTTAMFAMTYAAAHVLKANAAPSQAARLRSVHRVIVAACLATLLAWPVCGVAFLPFALWVLLAAPLPSSFAVLLSTAGLLLLPAFLLDRLFYGRPTLALYNFVRYNVFGGGESHLYGVEGFEYYFVSGLLNFNGVWVLALVFPFLGVTELLLQMAQASSASAGGLTTVDAAPSSATAIASAYSHYTRKLFNVLLALSPIYVWTAVLSALPHKEERFLYVVYPLICLAGAICLQMLEAFLRGILRVPASAVNRLVTAGLTAVTLVSVARTMGLIAHYGAPIKVWSALPAEPAPVLARPSRLFKPDISVVCVGAEWHRFPSSFFLPNDRYRVGFLKTGFDGMLPTYFYEDDFPFGGTRAAPPMLNDRNKEDPRQYVEGPQHCSYLVQLEPQENFVASAPRQWRLLRSDAFLDASASPLMSRVLYLPGALGEKDNAYSRYRLYERVARPDPDGTAAA